MLILVIEGSNWAMQYQLLKQFLLMLPLAVYLLLGGRHVRILPPTGACGSWQLPQGAVPCPQGLGRLQVQPEAVVHLQLRWPAVTSVAKKASGLLCMLLLCL